MAKRTRRIHLLVRRQRVACGSHVAARTTTSPSLVTCHNCIRSPHMADAEVKQQLHRKRTVQ